MHDIGGTVSRRQTSAGTHASLPLEAFATYREDRSTLGSLGKANFAAIDATKWSSDAGIASRDQLLVVADARIDDRDRLVKELGLAPLSSGAPTDSELIAEAYIKWGEDCPLHLFGDYAFAVYDAAADVLFCARDHIGARPFFYALDDRCMTFASDCAVLLASPGISNELDEDYVATALLHRRFELRDGSFYKAIRRLDAGHCLTVRAGGHVLRRYWRPELVPPIDLPDDEAYVATGRAILDRAIADRLVHIERPAVHLSGGIDSSLVAALAVPMLRAAAKPEPKGYSWHEVRSDANPDEEPGLTEAIRAALDLTVEAPELSPEEMADLFAQDWTCGPDIRNLLHEAAIQRDAEADGVDVILSGWGGDEGISFNGRGLLPELLWRGRWRRLFFEAPQPGLRERLRVFYAAARKLVFAVRPDPPARWRSIQGKSLVAPSLVRRAKLQPIPRLRETSVRRTQLGLLSASSITARLEDWALSGRRHGIEYRYPLLDRRILEFTYGLPAHLFRQKGTRRWLVREIARGLVPDAIRLNDSKLEPLRCAWLEQAVTDAMLIVADRLDARASEPSRARYLDMPRLHARLAAIRAGTMTGRQNPLRLALQFLDFA